MDFSSVKQFFASLTLQKILPVLLIFIVGLIVVKLLLSLFSRMLGRSKLEKTMFPFLKMIMRLLLYFLLGLVVAGSLGVDVSSLVAVLSVISLAVSLAVQNTLTNVVGSVSLLTTHPFRVGDFVEIGADSGTVEEISLSYTKIRTPDAKRIYIPNSDAAAARITNFSIEGKRRIELTFSASDKDSVEKVKAALIAVGANQKILPDTQPEVFVNGYQDGCVEYLMHIWVMSEEYAQVRFAVIEEVKKAFDAQGISIPYPQMDVHLSDGTAQ